MQTSSMKYTPPEDVVKQISDRFPSFHKAVDEVREGKCNFSANDLALFTSYLRIQAARIKPNWR
jgi:hypothetical protein